MSDRSLKDAIQQLAGTFNKDIVSIVACSVDSVDQDKRTCDCTAITGDAITDIPGVQLMAEVGDGILLLPSVDSTVIVGLSTRNTAFVLMYSDIGKIIFRGGQYDGLVKVTDLVSKINALENLVNNILDTLKSTSIPLAPSGTYPFAPLYAAFSDISPITQKSDLENTNITHG